VVRTARADDLDAWAALRHDLWPEGSLAEHRREAARWLAAPPAGTAVLLADDGGRLAGFVELSIRAYAEGCLTDRVGYLEGWYVAPHARRRGVGRLLVAAAEVWAREQGCAEFASDTEAANEASAAAHRALGFTDAGLIRCFIKPIAPHAEGDRRP
jgi:aminoglycoside 6'-N-acetyltransferase I